MAKRDGFASRLGFILVSAGCAIGIGNVWKFPWLAGVSGGGIFVLFYLLFLLIMGVPVLTMELAVGRSARKACVGAYKSLEPRKSKWHIHGWFCIAGCYLLMMYYTTVSGWMLSYFVKFLTGAFNSITPEASGAVFTAMLSNPVEMTIYMAITVLAGFAVVGFGVQKGLERITKYTMGALLALIGILVIHSLTLSGAKEGLAFFLLPNLENVKAVGVGNVIVSAMIQAFFTLSIGIAAMEIFGSYMSDDHTLAGESIRIGGLDTMVAIMAGLIIFPACFTFGVEPNSGPALIFVTLPQVFMDMAGGRIWGTLFFLFMTFASFSTVIAVFENLLANCCECFHWSRKKATLINCAFILVASLPCVFGYNIWSDLRLIHGKDVLDTEDFLVSNLLLPGGALVYLLFCVSKWGWGYDKYLAEANRGKGLKLPTGRGFKLYLQYVLPVMILVILIGGLISFFGS